jgi:hypothetical protein
MWWKREKKDMEEREVREIPRKRIPLNSVSGSEM